MSYLFFYPVCQINPFSFFVLLLKKLAVVPRAHCYMSKFLCMAAKVLNNLVLMMPDSVGI